MNNTLVKGFAILELLALAPEGLGVTELSNRLQITKSNVHRLLQALVELGYANKSGNGNYQISLKVWSLGSRSLGSVDLRGIATPALEKLLGLTRETVHLSVLDGDEVVYLHKIDSPEPILAYTTIGGRAPATCVATGKALLSVQPASLLTDLARRLREYTTKTITNADAFLAEMARVREQGYAVNHGEWRETVGGIGAPIFDASGKAVAAVGISGPLTRIESPRLTDQASHVVQAATSIESALARMSHSVGR